ncbi:MAG: hypothetical protein ACOYOU_18780, partial [Kiritimatiellia bacterium]
NMRNDIKGNDSVRDTPLLKIPREPLLHKFAIGQDLRDFSVPASFRSSLGRSIWSAIIGNTKGKK